MPKSKPKSKKQKSSSILSKLTALHPLVIISIVSVLLLVISANIQTTKYLTANSEQSVLGDDEDSSEDQDDDKDDEDEDIPDEDEDSSEDQDDDKDDEAKDDEDPEDDESEDSEEETEVETANGQKIKTKIKNGITTKIEIERGELKLKYEFKNGQLELKVENEDGKEVDLDEDELNELKDKTDELEGEEVEVKAISEDTVAFTKNQASAVTDFPLSVDIGTNLLILSTPEGQRIVTVLPDQAIQSLLETGVVNTIDSSVDAQILNQLGSSNNIVKLELKNKDIVYRIKGKKEHKILGFIPVNSPTTAFVSANSGSVVAQERSVLTSFVDLISP